MIPARHVLVEREVLLDDTRAHRHRRERNLKAERMVRVADCHPEVPPQRLDELEIHQLVLRRIQ